MCSLTQLADPGKPEFWSKDACEWLLLQPQQQVHRHCSLLSRSMGPASVVVLRAHKHHSRYTGGLLRMCLGVAAAAAAALLSWVR